MLDNPNLSESVATPSGASALAGAEAGPPSLCARGVRASLITKLHALPFFLILIVYVAARVGDLTSYGLFSDEIFSIWAVGNSWREMMVIVVEDVVHPPLFYLLLKAWVLAGGDSLLWLKLFPVLMSVAAVIPLFLLCRELKLKTPAANLTFALMAVNEYLITYSQELRMYSLLMLLTLSSMWLFAKYFNVGQACFKLQAALFAVNLLLVYTHYYGWLVVGGEFLFLLLCNRKKLLPFSLALTALVACFIPWIYLAAQASMKKGGLVANLGWNGRPTFGDMAWFYQILNGPLAHRWKGIGTPLVRLLFGFPVLLWGWRALKRKRADDQAQALIFSWLVLLSFLPTAVAFAASHLMAQSVWGLRFLIIVAPAYLLLVSVAALRLRPYWLRITTATLLMGWAAVSGLVQLNNRDKVSWEPLVRRMIQAEPAHPGITKVYTEKGNVGTTVQYYLNQANESRFEVVYIDYYTEPQEERFWVAYLEYAFEAQPQPQKILAERGYEIGDAIKAEAAGHKVFLFPAWLPRDDARFTTASAKEANVRGL